MKVIAVAEDGELLVRITREELAKVTGKSYESDCKPADYDSYQSWKFHVGCTVDVSSMYEEARQLKAYYTTLVSQIQGVVAVNTSLLKVIEPRIRKIRIP